MKPALSNKYIQTYTGLDVYRAKKKILRDFPDLDEKAIDIHYIESSHPRFTILKSTYNINSKQIELHVSSNNPLRHLPSNYQNNDFLSGFLMLFQHVINDTVITLDNMHSYFRPMESPVNFLSVLADWFGIQLDTLGDEEEVRRFLQYAIPLYRFRGTVLGLRAHLAIVSGIVPEIVEGQIPYSTMIISANAEAESNLFGTEDEANSFTVHFPVLRSKVSDTLIRRLSLIVQREKPAHTRAYISFERAKKQTRKITIIDTDTVMGINDGISM